jgi:hypothetical protein
MEQLANFYSGLARKHWLVMVDGSGFGSTYGSGQIIVVFLPPV